MTSQSTLFHMWCSHHHSPCPCCTSLYAYLHWIPFIVLLPHLCLLSSFLTSSYLKKQLALEKESSSLRVQYKKVQDRVGLVSYATVLPAWWRDSACHTNHATQRLLRVPIKCNSANSDHKQLASLTRRDRRAELEKPVILLECQDLWGVSPPKHR